MRFEAAVIRVGCEGVGYERADMRVGCERAAVCGAFLRDSDTGAVTPTGTLTPDGAYLSRLWLLGHDGQAPCQHHQRSNNRVYQ